MRHVWNGLEGSRMTASASRFMARSVGLVGLALTMCAIPAGAGDWAHWRGPEQNGISRELNLVEEWSLNPPQNVLWTSEIGGRSTPIVLNGKVYLNCRTEHDVTNPNERIHAREQVICWDAATGEILWRDVFNVFQTDIPQPRIGWASMAGDPETGNIYLHSVSGLFRCYSGDGEVLWEHSLFEEFGRISGYGGRTQNPIIDEDRVIVGYMTLNWGDQKTPPAKQRYHAFDKKSGKLIWTSAPGGAPADTTYSNPIVAVIDGVRMLIAGNSDGSICAIHARTGEFLWTFRMSRRGLNTTPVVEGNKVFIAHGEDNIDNNLFGRVQCIDATGRGDITETHGIWRVDDIKVGYTGLLIHDGILYAVSDTGMLIAYDSGTGEKLWDFKLGTVGKGSPVWADGKIYVMEVNGNIHIVRPSREKCESLSHLELFSPRGNATDEIYASPAISNGRIYFVTRDRTICIGREGHEVASDPIPPMPEEPEVEQEVALLHLVPNDVSLRPGDSVEYELYAYDRNGRFIEKKTPTLTAGDNLPHVEVSGNTVTVPTETSEQGGTVTAKVGDVEATARIRVFPALPWKWDFEGMSDRDVPPTWVAAFTGLRPAEVNGTVTMVNRPGPARPSTYVWIGPANMSGYTIQADVMMTEERRRLPSVGITAQRYNLILKGNNQRLSVTTWPPHVTMDKEISFRADPDVWYRMKLRVDPAEEGEGCVVRGKVWKRDEDEPDEWTIEASDPYPNEMGSPGLYAFSLADSHFDNVIVFEEE
jgi:outer membrane protein assembly factor BamB